MRLVIEEAAKAGNGVFPNPRVGAVLVKKEKLLGAAHHERFGGAHAEAALFAKLGKQARGGTLYVTLEPCAHRGKTPPCCEAVARSGVKRVVVAARDPNPQVAGQGIRYLRRSGVEVIEGVLRDEAVRAAAPHFKYAAEKLPLVTLKWGMSLDGKTALADGSSKWITGPDARQGAHRLRARVDAVMAGIGTVLADDPLLTARGAPCDRQPLRVVVDSGARLPLDSKLVRTAALVPVLVAVTGKAPASRLRALSELGCEVVPFPGSRVPLRELLAELAARQIRHVLVEGGPTLATAFWEQGLADHVAAWIAPVLVGGKRSKTPLAGRGVPDLASVTALSGAAGRMEGRDFYLEGWLAEPSRWLRNPASPEVPRA